MEVKATLTPGQNDTKQLLKQDGDQFICVRCPYDNARQKPLKTNEIKIDEENWIPSISLPVDQRIPVKIGFEESKLREQMKKADACGDPDKRPGCSF